MESTPDSFDFPSSSSVEDVEDDRDPRGPEPLRKQDPPGGSSTTSPPSTPPGVNLHHRNQPGPSAAPGAHWPPGPAAVPARAPSPAQPGGIRKGSEGQSSSGACRDGAKGPCHTPATGRAILLSEATAESDVGPESEPGSALDRTAPKPEYAWDVGYNEVKRTFYFTTDDGDGFVHTDGFATQHEAAAQRDLARIRALGPELALQQGLNLQKGWEDPRVRGAVAHCLPRPPIIGPLRGEALAAAAFGYRGRGGRRGRERSRLPPGAARQDEGLCEPSPSPPPPPARRSRGRPRGRRARAADLPDTRSAIADLLASRQPHTITVAMVRRYEIDSLEGMGPGGSSRGAGTGRGAARGQGQGAAGAGDREAPLPPSQAQRGRTRAAREVAGNGHEAGQSDPAAQAQAPGRGPAAPGSGGVAGQPQPQGFGSPITPAAFITVGGRELRPRGPSTTAAGTGAGAAAAAAAAGSAHAPRPRHDTTAQGQAQSSARGDRGRSSGGGGGGVRGSKKGGRGSTPSRSRSATSRDPDEEPFEFKAPYVSDDEVAGEGLSFKDMETQGVQAHKGVKWRVARVVDTRVLRGNVFASKIKAGIQSDLLLLQHPFLTPQEARDRVLNYDLGVHNDPRVTKLLAGTVPPPELAGRKRRGRSSPVSPRPRTRPKGDGAAAAAAAAAAAGKGGGESSEDADAEDEAEPRSGGEEDESEEGEGEGMGSEEEAQEKEKGPGHSVRVSVPGEEMKGVQRGRTRNLQEKMEVQEERPPGGRGARRGRGRGAASGPTRAAATNGHTPAKMRSGGLRPAVPPQAAAGTIPRVSEAAQAQRQEAARPLPRPVPVSAAAAAPGLSSPPPSARAFRSNVRQLVRENSLMAGSPRRASARLRGEPASPGLDDLALTPRRHLTLRLGFSPAPQLEPTPGPEGEQHGGPPAPASGAAALQVEQSDVGAAQAFAFPFYYHPGDAQGPGQSQSDLFGGTLAGLSPPVQGREGEEEGEAEGAELMQPPGEEALWPPEPFNTLNLQGFESAGKGSLGGRLGELEEFGNWE